MINGLLILLNVIITVALIQATLPDLGKHSNNDIIAVPWPPNDSSNIGTLIKSTRAVISIYPCVGILTVL